MRFMKAILTLVVLVPLVSVGMPAAALDTDNDGIVDAADPAPTTPFSSTDWLYYRFTADHTQDFMGESVSAAGDVNKDGYVDLVVGLRNCDINGENSGAVHVYSGADGSLLYNFHGAGVNYQFGAIVSDAGDVNGDGYADIIAGENGAYHTPISARVYSGKDGAQLYVVTDTTGTSGPYETAGIGDVNQDGYDDFALGKLAGLGLVTHAIVYSGKNGSQLYDFSGTGQFGLAIGAAGDVNADGYPDIVIGARYDATNGSQAGKAVVYSGRNGSLLHTFLGSAAGQTLGNSVAGAGDVNADGYDDIVVGTANKDLAWIYSGRNGAMLYQLVGETVGDAFGRSVAGAGDVNADGYADVVIGAMYAYSGAGRVRVFSGRDGSVLYSMNGGSGSYFGYAVSTAGDVNHDGFADVFVGASTGNRASVHSSAAALASWDTDNDGIKDNVDNCRLISNVDQINTDNASDGGDTCDTDDDNDSALDVDDAFPLDATETLDTDGDGTGNNADADDDGDSYADTEDAYPLNPYKWKFPSCDFDGDSDSDILVRDLVTGLWKIFNVQAAVVTSNVTIDIPDDVYTQHIAALDSDGDGDKDILTRNSNTGLWTLYEVDAGDTVAAHPLPLYANTAWKVVSTGDFNGDAVDDVLLRDSAGGSYRTFLLGNHAVTQVKYFNGWLSSQSVDQGVGDFDGDGTDDLLVRRSTDNLYFIYRVLNGDVASIICLCNLWKNPDWTFQFASDLNADGTSDIVIRGTGATGDGKWWRFRINNHAATEKAYLNLFYNKDRVSLGAVGDYNGDGTNDVMVRVDNAATYVSPVTGGLVTGTTRIGNFGAGEVIEQ